MSNLLPLYYRYADRYAFLALALTAPALAALWDRTCSRRAVAPIVAVLILAEGVLSVRQAEAWTSSRALWRRATANQPGAFFAHLKLGETMREAGEWRPCIEAYQRAVRLQPDNALGYAGLFHAYATRAERSRQLAPGTAAGWLATLGAAVSDREIFDRFEASVGATSCKPCAGVLLALRLRRWATEDAVLLRQAAAALDRGDPSSALILLESVRDRSRPGYEALLRAAQGE